MSKRRFARFGALLTTLVAAGALISTLVAGSGAYYTATQPGQITGNLGTVAVDVAGTAINFANLMPGDTQNLKVGPPGQVDARRQPEVDAVVIDVVEVDLETGLGGYGAHIGDAEGLLLLRDVHGRDKNATTTDISNGR